MRRTIVVVAVISALGLWDSLGLSLFSDPQWFRLTAASAATPGTTGDAGSGGSSGGNGGGDAATAGDAGSGGGDGATAGGDGSYRQRSQGTVQTDTRACITSNNVVVDVRFDGSFSWTAAASSADFMRCLRAKGYTFGNTPSYDLSQPIGER